MSSERNYIQSTTVVARRISGETLIVPVRSGVGDMASIYSLNEVGSLIWQALAKPMTPDALTMLVLAEFEVERATAQGHVTAFLEELQSAGLVAAAA